MEIKFRAWDKRKRIMVYQNENNSADYWDGVHASEIELVNSILRDSSYEFMQYTGLKDFNGTEIYEGDIVRVYGGEYWYGCWELDIRGEVVFDVFSFGVKSKDRFYPFNYAFEPYDHKIKVIGNVYENPELLEGSK